MLVYQKGIRIILNLVAAQVQEGTVFRLCQEILHVVVAESFMSENALAALRKEVNERLVSESEQLKGHNDSGCCNECSLLDSSLDANSEDSTSSPHTCPSSGRGGDKKDDICRCTKSNTIEKFENCNQPIDNEMEDMVVSTTS